MVGSQLAAQKHGNDGAVDGQDSGNPNGSEGQNTPGRVALRRDSGVDRSVASADARKKNGQCDTETGKKFPVDSHGKGKDFGLCFLQFTVSEIVPNG
jgi:hypothetical protein